MARLVSFFALVAILIGIGLLFMQVMWGFLLPLFLAALLGVVFQPLYAWCLGKCQNYRYLASGITTALVLLSVMIPAGTIATMAAMQGLSLVDRLQVATVPDKLKELRRYYGLEIPQATDIYRVQALLDHWREQQWKGDAAEYTPERVDNLLARVTRLETYLDDQKDAVEFAGGREELAKLRQSLQELREAKPETVEGDEALAQADANFRIFKREFLGGSLRSWVKEWTNPTDEQLKSLRSSILGRAGSPLVSLGSDTLAIVARFVFGIIIMVTALFFFLAEGNRMIDAIVRLSPLEEKYLRELIEEFERISRAVVAATLLAAVAQGILAGVGFYFAGLESVALLVILTTVLAMVPFAGAATVWVPVCCYLYFYEGHATTAIVLAMYSAGIVSTADNFIKPMVLHGQSNLHPLLALLSVLGGVTSLGPIGIMVGPMVVVFLQTLLKILQREMLSLDKMNRLPLATWATAWKSGEHAEQESAAAMSSAADAPSGKETVSPLLDKSAPAPAPAPLGNKKKHKR